MTTIAIIDLAHSGTTMLAGICEILGVPMVGKEYKRNKWEDLEIAEALKDERAFAELAARRDAAHANWGFKKVGAWLAPWLDNHLTDAVYFAIYKDVVSTTWRRFGKCSTNKVLNTVEQTRRSVAGIRESGLPVHWLSYQRAVTDPVHFVSEVAHAAGLVVHPERLRKAVAWIQPNTAGPRAPYPELTEWL